VASKLSAWQPMRSPGRARQAAILRAEGYALALSTIYDVAQTLDANTMSLQYLDALKELGAGSSTKFVIPMEFASLLRSVTGRTGTAFGNSRPEA
jgi:hypothetical protein